MASARRGHRVLPHTADVILEAWGPDLAACCEEAVAALVRTYADPAGAPVADGGDVQLPPAHPEELLLGVLEEVIFALDTADAVPVGATVTEGPDGGLTVVLRSADRGRVRLTGSGPKAVARSELEVESGDDGVRCHVLVDV